MLRDKYNRTLITSIVFCLLSTCFQFSGVSGWPDVPSPAELARRAQEEADRRLRETREAAERLAREAQEKLDAGNLANRLVDEAKKVVSSISIPSLDSYVQKFNAVPNLEKLAKKQESLASKSQLRSLVDLKKKKQALQGIIDTVQGKINELRSKRDEYTKKLGDIPFGLGNDFKNQIQSSSDAVLNAASQQFTVVKQCLLYLDAVSKFAANSTKQMQNTAAAVKNTTQNATKNLVENVKESSKQVVAGAADFAKALPGAFSNLLKPPASIWVLELSTDKTGLPIDFVNIIKATETPFVPGTKDIASAIIAFATKRQIPWPDSKESLIKTINSLRDAAKAAKNIAEGKVQLQGVLDNDAKKFVTTDIKDLKDLMESANVAKLNQLGTKSGDKYAYLSDAGISAVSQDLGSVIDILQAFDDTGEFTVAKATEMKTSIVDAIKSFNGAAESYNNYDATTAEAKQSLKGVLGKDLSAAEAQGYADKFKNVLKNVFGQSFAEEDAKEAKAATEEAKSAAEAKAAKAAKNVDKTVRFFSGPFSTPGNGSVQYKDEWSVSAKNSIVLLFEAHGRDASIGFSTDKAKETYAILFDGFGDNHETVVSKNGAELKRVGGIKVDKDNDYSSYWVKIDGVNKTVSFGKGSDPNGPAWISISDNAMDLSSIKFFTFTSWVSSQQKIRNVTIYPDFY